MSTLHPSSTRKRLRRWSKGDNIAAEGTADHFNEAVDRLNEMSPIAAPEQATGPVMPVFKHFRVQTEYADYVIAREAIGTDGLQIGDTDVKLAKPPELRQTEYEQEVDGTITWAKTSVNERTATDSSDDSTEDQVIVPAFLTPDLNGDGDFKGRLVLAVRGIANGTLVDVDGEKVFWQIISAAAWAKDDSA